MIELKSVQQSVGMHAGADPDSFWKSRTWSSKPSNQKGWLVMKIHGRAGAVPTVTQD